MLASMTEQTPGESAPKSSLDQITTRWASLKDPVQFLLRYGSAIRKYLLALLKNPHDADEVSQDILARFLQEGFARASPDRGRFRDYLKVSVRNAALSQLRKKHAIALPDAALQQLADPEEGQEAVERAWLAEWQRCILDKAWRGLDQHERRSPGNLFNTVLRISTDHADEDSKRLAERTAKQIGRPLTPEAFRKQLSRARHLFAQLLVDEVAVTLQDPTPEQVEEEMIEVGLLDFVRDFLPPDWRTQGRLWEAE